jgi:hypothetical protein
VYYSHKGKVYRYPVIPPKGEKQTETAPEVCPGSHKAFLDGS